MLVFFWVGFRDGKRRGAEFDVADFLFEESW